MPYNPQGAPGIGKLSQLEIDVDKDWQSMGISNLKELAADMAHGDVVFRGATALQKLLADDAGKFLKTLGPGADPVWDDIPGGRAERLEYLTIDIDVAISDPTTQVKSVGGQTIDKSLVVTPPSLAKQVVKMDQYYDQGDDGEISIYDNFWEGQTFTVNENHDIEIVELKIGKVGSPGDLTIGIRETSGGLPTGGDLVYVTVSQSEVGTSADWLEKALSAYSLTASVKYAIVLRAPGGNASNYYFWRVDGTSPAYTGGARVYSDNSGSSWNEDLNNDFMFREGSLV